MLLIVSMILLWLLGTSVAAFVAFGEDKRRAELRVRRIPERTLLKLAVIGGTIGAYLGRRHYRHKTRKASFSAQLHMIAVIQGIGITFLVMQGLPSLS